MSFIDYWKKREAQTGSMKQVGGIDEDLLTELRQNAAGDEQEFPEDEDNIRSFKEYLQSYVKWHVEKLFVKNKGKAPMEVKVDAETFIYFSEDKMTAYLCILPPLGGGKDAALEQVKEDLRFEGLVYGLDEAILQRTIERKYYLHIVPVARGKKPVDGQDAIIFDLFKRENAYLLEVEEDSQIDFDEANLMQTVRKGEVISRLEPATQGIDGMDVTGRTLTSKNGRPLCLTGGENTVVSHDGQFLLAGIDGVVSTHSGEFCVERYSVFFEDISVSSGNLDLPGGVIIKGDVRDGMTVRASGNVIIEGAVLNASIYASGSVRVQNGIWGSKKSSVHAAGQVQSKIIENATVIAGGSVFSEAIVDSNITSACSIHATGGRGILAGGQVKVRFLVEAKRIGKWSGCLNIIILNYNPELKNQVWAVQDKLEDTQDTLRELRKHIADLRSKGSKLSPEEKSVMKRLTEQRDLYERQESDLLKQVEQLKQGYDNIKANRVVSDEILPTTVIRLGEKALSVKEVEKRCDVHMKNGELRVR